MICATNKNRRKEEGTAGLERSSDWFALPSFSFSIFRLPLTAEDENSSGTDSSTSAASDVGRAFRGGMPVGDRDETTIANSGQGQAGPSIFRPFLSPKYSRFKRTFEPIRLND